MKEFFFQINRFKEILIGINFAVNINVTYIHTYIHTYTISSHLAQCVLTALPGENRTHKIGVEMNKKVKKNIWTKYALCMLF